ncbi:flagellar biosynthesis anti-sigma factor FlgM [Methylobacter sp. S3L5C]|uniref:flagellar biosynthesis anti-sigma factor FlgM n=1 Tax=Methylobacter sp. S3L5C TaxID=2839024 RepID=UPI001FAD9654|nr:flagellar biosynthesis anti-sigma factor FlgM [Methylobacter sp. S3L5C]UOA08765.1 flagellar biosynthesis anti-sigma factor FlgM [Methylobacter sp. S3L5C]
MKIDNPVGNITNPPPIDFQPKHVKATEAPPVSPTPSSSVQLSEQLQALGALSPDTGIFNAEKVNKIKAAIAEGTFQVNATIVAEGMITTAKDLMVASKSLVEAADNQNDEHFKTDSITSAANLIVDSDSLKAKAKDLTKLR